MASLEDIQQKAGSKDVKERLSAIEDAVAYLGSEPVGTDAAPVLIDAMVPGLSDNNVKVAQGALGVLLSLVEQLEEIELAKAFYEPLYRNDISQLKVTLFRAIDARRAWAMIKLFYGANNIKDIDSVMKTV